MSPDELRTAAAKMTEHHTPPWEGQPVAEYVASTGIYALAGALRAMADEQDPPAPKVFDVAVERARIQRLRDELRCARCGGDRLRSDFTGSNACHVGGTARPPQGHGAGA